MTTILAVTALGMLVFLAHALDDLFTRTRVPDVLFLLALGMLAGPIFQVALPEHFGAFGPIFTTVTLVIILFEGGLHLDMADLLRGFQGALPLTLLNFLATLAIAAPFGRYLLDLPWTGALVLASALGGTSSAVVIPLVNRLSLGTRTRTALVLESALSDVLVIMITLGVLGADRNGAQGPWALAGQMGSSLFFAGFLGLLGGLAWSLALSRIHGLKQSIFTTPAFVCIVYGLVELLGYNGAIAALAMGVALGNLRRVNERMPRGIQGAFESLNATEKAVFAEVAFLLKTFFFVYAGISIRFGGWAPFLGGGLLVCLLFLARVPVVLGSLRARSASPRDAAVAALMNPKGLAAAAVASLPLQMGLPGGRLIQDMVFAVVLLSILASSLMTFLLEWGWLKEGRFFRAYGPSGPEPAAGPGPGGPEVSHHAADPGDPADRGASASRMRVRVG